MVLQIEAGQKPDAYLSFHVSFMDDVQTGLKIKPYWNWTSFNINPYVNEELFFAREKMSRNRIYAGFEAKTGSFEPAIYMFLQSDNFNNNWTHRSLIWSYAGY